MIKFSKSTPEPLPKASITKPGCKRTSGKPGDLLLQYPLWKRINLL